MKMTVTTLRHTLPYGERANDPALTRNGNNFLYGGKELQDRDDIDWYDSGARFQTTSGIFTSIDPEAEKYNPISPYTYCTGNPVNHIDPNGMTDWKLVKVGAMAFGTGTLGAIGGVAVSASGFGAAIGTIAIIDSFSSMGLGAAYIITGLASNPKDNGNMSEKVPTSATNVMAKSVEKISGSKSKAIEGWTEFTMGAIEFPTTNISELNVKDVASLLSSIGQMNEGAITVGQASTSKKNSTNNMKTSISKKTSSKSYKNKGSNIDFHTMYLNNLNLK